MKKIILLLLLFTSYNAFSQTDIYGMWGTVDGEYVEIFPDNTFRRYKLKGLYKRKETIAEGYIEYNDNFIEVFRTDTVDAYNLNYFMGYENMVISKPYEVEAWLWEKLHDY